MKSGNLFLLLLCILFSLQGNAGQYNATFDSANVAYSKKNYDKAIRLYELITAANQQSAELYFNLGNAYYQNGDIAAAILNYERAKRLDPGDEDIQVNLKLANQKTEDKIEPAPEMFLTELQNKLVQLMNEQAWAILCIVSLVIGLFLLGVFIAAKTNAWKKAGFYAGVAFIGFTLITFFIARVSYSASRRHQEAIITTAAVTVLGSPSESSTKLFILHKGSKVQITEENNEWIEVKIANGNVGWIKKELVERI